MNPVTLENDPLAAYYFQPEPETICGRIIKPITEEYIVNYPSVVDRFFTRYYYIKPGHEFAPYKVLFHSNRICLICLAPEHPAFEEGIASFNFDIGGIDRSKNNVSGKGKKGGMVLQADSSLGLLTTSTGKLFKVPSCVRSKLVEVNIELANQPERILSATEGDGYIAIVLPKIEQIDEIKSSLLTQAQYNEYILNRNEKLTGTGVETKIDDKEQSL